MPRAHARPNCQDSHSTYYGDFLSDDEGGETAGAAKGEMSEDYAQESPARKRKRKQQQQEYTNEELLQAYTPEEQERNVRLYNAEQRENYCQRQVRRFERLSEFSIDTDNQREYGARLSEWEERLTEAEKNVRKLRKSTIAGKSSGNEQGLKNNLSKLVGTLDFNDESAIIKSLRDFETTVVGLSYERCRTITSDGKIWDTDGSTGFVDTSSIEKRNGTSLKGSYSYHNHPPKQTHFSFSGEDVADFISKGEVYSKASDYKYSYIMRRTKDTIATDYDTIRNDFYKIYQSNVYQMSFDGIIDIDEDGFHETMKLLAEKYHFSYTRIDNNDR